MSATGHPWPIRLSILGLCVAAALAAATPNAYAHGGNFRADQPVPPGQPVAPVEDVPAPVITPRGGGGRGVGPRGRGRPWMSDDDWRTWWSLNGLRWSPPPGVAMVRRAVTEGDDSANPFALGDVGHGRMTTRLMELQLVRERVVEPLLLRMTAPTRDEHPDVRSSALLALGRMGQSPRSLSRLLGFAEDPEAPLVVRESAILGLGLLRRTERVRQRAPDVLGRVRATLLGLYDTEDVPVRLRAFAVYALGLLGDQPFPATALERDGRALSRALWQRVRAHKLEPSLRIALLGALALQPRRGVASGVYEMLARIVESRGRVPKFRWGAFERAHALHALCALRPAPSLQLLLARMADRRDHAVVRAAAVITTGHHARTFTSIARKVAAYRCMELRDREPHITVRGLHLITCAQLIRADLCQGTDRLVYGRGTPGDWLLQTASGGGTRLRPYGALGIGITVYDAEMRSRIGAIWQRRVHAHITRSLIETRGAHDAVTAWAVAAGVARALPAAVPLRDLVADKGAHGGLRQRAAAALGVVSERPGRDADLLLKQLRQRRSGALFLGAVRGLALLGEAGTAATLGEELGRTKSSSAQAAIAIALGRLRDPDAVPPLTRLLQDSKDTRIFVRSYAAVALGLLCDPERIPSKARLTVGVCYPARTVALEQIFNIL